MEGNGQKYPDQLHYVWHRRPQTYSTSRKSCCCYYGKEETTSSNQVNQFSAINLDPLQEYLQQLKRVLSDFWLLGIATIDSKTIDDWEKLSQLAKELGLVYQKRARAQISIK